MKQKLEVVKNFLLSFQIRICTFRIFPTARHFLSCINITLLNQIVVRFFASVHGPFPWGSLFSKLKRFWTYSICILCHSVSLNLPQILIRVFNDCSETLFPNRESWFGDSTLRHETWHRGSLHGMIHSTVSYAEYILKTLFSEGPRRDTLCAINSG